MTPKLSTQISHRVGNHSKLVKGYGSDLPGVIRANKRLIKFIHEVYEAGRRNEEFDMTFKNQ